MNFDTVFIMTYGRSGSTLLQGIINTIPEVKVLGENYNILFNIYKCYENARRARFEFGQRETSSRDPWFGADKIDLEGFRFQLIQAFKRSVIQADSRYKAVGFKEIRYGHGAMTDREFNDYMSFIKEAFPRSCCVINTRDVDDVKTSAWYANDPNAERYLVQVDKRLREFAASNKDRAIHLHFNSYISDIEALKPLFDFLGARFDRTRVGEVMSRIHSSQTVRSS